MGKLVPTNQLILGYEKRGKLVYDTSREPELKIPGFNQSVVSYQDADGKSKWVGVDADGRGGLLYNGQSYANADALVSALTAPVPVTPTSSKRAYYQQRNYDVWNPDLDTSAAQNTLKRVVSAPLAAASNFLTDAGTALRNERAGQDYMNLLKDGQSHLTPAPGTYGVTNLVTSVYDAKQAGAEARENFKYLTDAEKKTALGKSGAELGAYVNSLNLSERRRAAETEARQKTAAGFETNVGAAVKRESALGRRVASFAAGNAYPSGAYGRKSAYEFLTDRQRETIAKYAEAGDFQSVADYWESVLPDLNAKAAADNERNNEAFGKKHPVLSMGTQLLSGMAGAIPSAAKVVGGNVANAVTGEYKDIAPNSPEFALTAASSAQARGAEDAIQGMTPETNPKLYAAKPLLSIMRSGTVSAAQNLFLMALGGGPAAGASAVDAVLGGMALSSAGQAGYETLKEGGSAGKALADAVVSAAIETGTEKIGMERWFKVLNEFDPKLVGKSLRQMVRQLPAQMFTEGMEEVLGNELERTWDMLSEGDRSEYANRIRTLEADGMSRADAAREAAYELHALRDIRAFAEAAFSTLLMDGVPATASAVREGRTFAAVGQGIRANGGDSEGPRVRRRLPGASGGGSVAKEKGRHEQGPWAAVVPQRRRALRRHAAH